MSFAKSFANSIYRVLKNGKCLLALLICVIQMCLCVGCSIPTDSELYQNIEQQTQTIGQQTVSNGVSSIEDWPKKIGNKLLDISNILKATAPIIIVVSMVIGFLLLHLIDKEQKMRQKAVFIFILGIPIVDFLGTYGVAWLAGMFYQN